MATDSDDQTTGTESSVPMDFSAVAAFDPMTVPVVQKQIVGLAGGPPRAHPLGAALGYGSAGRYSAYELFLHRHRRALLQNHILAAERSSIPPELALAELTRDIYEVISPGAVRIADLSNHPVLYQVPLSARRLRSASAGSVEWELVRMLRDSHGTVAIRLPCREGAGNDLIVHADLAHTLRIRRLGTLPEVLPILSENAVASLALPKLLIRLLRGG